MSTSYKGDVSVNSAVYKKTVAWEIDGKSYRILNVPYSEFNDEDYYDLDVSLKLAMIKDLMVKKEIPREVDFNDVSSLDVSWLFGLYRSSLSFWKNNNKHINVNTSYESFYRWGIQGGRTGNHRIIYAIHNYHKVIMLYHFDKQYNGLIKRKELIPAELNYENYCILDPNFY